MNKAIVISTSTELVRVPPASIAYISSDGNYSYLVQTNGETRMISYQLGQIEEIIKKQTSIFIRVGKQLIINRNYIYYINMSRQELKLSDATTFSCNVSASKEALKQLKELVEKEVL